MESYEDLRASIHKQICEGRLISDRKRATPGDKINEWLNVSRDCLTLMEDRARSLLRDFNGLKFRFSIREEDILSDVLEEGEDGCSQSWYRDGGDHPIDFDFSALQQAVKLLVLADQKLQLDSQRATVHDPGPKLPAQGPGSGNTQKMAPDESEPDTALPNGGNSTVAEAGSAVNGPNTVGAHRRAILQPILDKLGYSRSKWATRAGVDPSVVYKYMSGTSDPNAGSRKVLAEAIGLSADKLPT